MNAPASPHFAPVDLAAVYNLARDHLDDVLRPSPQADPGHGRQSFRGIPFQLGAAAELDVIHLRGTGVEIPLEGAEATFAVFLHCAADIPTPYWPGLADWAIDGNWLGAPVSAYRWRYADGSTADVTVKRRFAIQQLRIGWGASAFEAVPHRMPRVHDTVMETLARQEQPRVSYGYGEVRHVSARQEENLWLYALPNPHPERPLDALLLEPLEEASTVYGVSLTRLRPHPLRWLPRRKLRIQVPAGLDVTATHDVKGLELDMGRVISARSVCRYDVDQWTAEQFEVQPTRVAGEAVVEYAAHPDACLYALTDGAAQRVVALRALTDDARAAARIVPPADKPVKLRFVLQDAPRRPVPVRLHMHGTQGEYLPPKGAHRRVNPHWFEDNYGEFVNGDNQYAYVPGECVADLPLGPVYLEAVCGLEIEPVRRTLDITPATEEITVELRRRLDWRARGWVSADTHVHFLSPTTAWLEGAAEGVNVVNLLASQWGEMFSNVTDFDGRTTLGAREFGGDGEFLVRVGTENRMHVLGHISLLGYSGAMIHPLCTGGPDESALGDPQENSMADWARRCMDQDGLVIMPHAPNPQCERAADIVLGLVHGMEMMVFNPYVAQIRPYGLADWYRFLNLGYHLPVVGGSDKMSASSLLGGVRTYACLGQDEFTYARWMQAVKDGRTFVTVGPLVDVTVEGAHPGGRLRLPASGGTVHVEWTVESIRLPVRQVEVLVGGRIVQRRAAQGERSLSGACAVPIAHSSWIAVRVRGSFGAYREQIAAHSSAVMVEVEGSPHFNDQDALSILAQIEGAQAYVDTLAPRPDAQRFQALRLTLEQAYNRLHHRLHAQGVFHQHAAGANGREG